MKKLPRDYRLRQSRLVRKRHRSWEKARLRRKRRRLSSPLSADHRQQILLPAPTVLGLEQAFFQETTAFFHTVRAALTDSHRVLVDFSQTDLLTASGAVYLYSEIDRAKRPFGWNAIRLNHHVSEPIARRQLQDSGLLKVANGGPAPRGKMPIVTGFRDDRVNDIVNYILFEAFHDDQLREEDLWHAELVVYRAISEAMLNVLHHAYPNKPSRRWWLAATIVDEQFFVAFCDRGIGMPKTLQQPNWLTRLGLRAAKDSELIKAAMVYTRTSTLRPGRGLGTRDIQDLARETHARGSLEIISGRGRYTYVAQDDHEEAEETDFDIGGTLIQWLIPLTKGTQHQ